MVSDERQSQVHSEIQIHVVGAVVWTYSTLKYSRRDPNTESSVIELS